MLAVTSFEAKNSVFSIADENNSFSISTPGHWSSREGADTRNRLHTLKELGFQNDIELHVEEVRRNANQRKVNGNKYNFSDLHSRKKEIIEKLKNA